MMFSSGCLANIKAQSIRICGKYKVTLSKCLIGEKYSVPNVEEVLADIVSGKTFAKFDLWEA